MMAMRSILLAATALASACLLAFDSERWLSEQRGDDSDMLRLRAEYAKCVKRIDVPAENVVLPIEFHANGAVKSRLKAGKAFMFADTGLIWGEKIRVEQYREDGRTVEASLVADNCIIDRKAKSGWVEGNARMDWDGTSVSGRGIYFSFDREFVKIFSQTEIRTKALKLGAGEVLSK